MRGLVVPRSGLKSRIKFRARRGQWQGNGGRRRRQTQLERALWNSFKAASLPSPEAKGAATLLWACLSSSIQPFCPCTFCARVLTILQSKSLRYHFEWLCPGQKNLKLELRLFVSLPPGEAEIWMNCSYHVLLHNSWVEITMKCFAEILKISRENVHCKIHFRALTNTEYRKKRPWRPLRRLCFTFFSLYCSFVSSLITLNKWVNICVGDNTSYTSC